MSLRSAITNSSYKNRNHSLNIQFSINNIQFLPLVTSSKSNVHSPVSILCMSHKRAELNRIFFSLWVKPPPRSIWTLKAVDQGLPSKTTWEIWISALWSFIPLWSATADMVRAIQLPNAPTIISTGHMPVSPSASLLDTEKILSPTVNFAWPSSRRMVDNRPIISSPPHARLLRPRSLPS